MRLLVAIAAVLFAACGSASPSGPPPSEVFRAATVWRASNRGGCVGCSR